MLVDETQLKERIESPANLLNRLKNLDKRNGSNFIPCIPPKSNDIVKDMDEKLQFVSVRKKASSILMKAMNQLEIRIPEINDPKKLSNIASEMGKVISSTKDDNANINPPQFIVYTPMIMKESAFPVIDLSRTEQ